MLITATRHIQSIVQDNADHHQVKHLPAAAVVPAPLAMATNPRLAKVSVVATAPTNMANIAPAGQHSATWHGVLGTDTINKMQQEAKLLGVDGTPSMV